MKKTLTKNKNNYAPRLPEEQINKIVQELSNPNLLPFSKQSEEDLLLLKVLGRKLKEGTIKAEMTKDGKLWLKTSKPILGGATQVNYSQSTSKRILK